MAKAAPDGYTLLVADVTQIAVNPHLFPSLPYDPLKELTGVSLRALRRFTWSRIRRSQRTTRKS